ncbi:MAG: hypothetical protein WD749_02145 [Phycisphaerales bacterium]
MPRRAVVSLILGLITSVTIAWSVAWTPPTGPGSQALWGKQNTGVFSSSGFPLNWYVLRSGSWGRQSNEFRVDLASSVSSEQAANFRRLTSDRASRAALERHAFLLKSKDSLFCSFGVHFYGWPLPCLTMEEACTPLKVFMWKALVLTPAPYDVETPDAPGLWDPDPANSLLPYYSALQIGEDHALPLRPLWDGLLTCTALYGTAWYVMLSLWSVVRRARIRPGFCSHCGYDLRGLSAAKPCPECGRES